MHLALCCLVQKLARRKNEGVWHATTSFVATAWYSPVSFIET
jgi:hypothetical protein